MRTRAGSEEIGSAASPNLPSRPAKPNAYWLVVTRPTSETAVRFLPTPRRAARVRVSVRVGSRLPSLVASGCRSRHPGSQRVGSPNRKTSGRQETRGDDTRSDLACRDRSEVELGGLLLRRR